MSVYVSYGNDLIIEDAYNQTKTLTTAGKWLEHDITFADSSSGNKWDLCQPKDVDFIDYDGRLLYSYTVDEFCALSALPANPSINSVWGLTAQGWNWTLDDAKPFVRQCGGLVIGQNYTTSDGKTKIYITIDNDYINSSFPTIPIHINVPSSATWTINWGDGTSSGDITTSTPHNISLTSASSYVHTYTQPGDYVIQIQVKSGSVRLGEPASMGYWKTIVGEYGLHKSIVKKVEIGDGVIGICRCAFYNFYNLKSISIPTTCKEFEISDQNNHAMFCGESLTGLVFPSGTNGGKAPIVSTARNDCMSLKYISIPKSMDGFRIRGNYLQSLRKLVFPSYNSNTNLDAALYNASMCTHYIAPGTYTTIPTDTCRESIIKKLIIPETVTSIANTAFRYNGALKEVRMLPTTPPTIYTDTFTGGPSDRVYYVPYSADHSILNAYKAANIWSTFADRIYDDPLYTTNGLVAYWNMSKYQDGYTGSITDEVNNLPIIVTGTGLETIANYAPWGGIHDGIFYSAGRYSSDTKSVGLRVPNAAGLGSYPQTYELYGIAHTSIYIYSATEAYSALSGSTYWAFLSGRYTDTAGENQNVNGINILIDVNMNKLTIAGSAQTNRISDEIPGGIPMRTNLDATVTTKTHLVVCLSQNPAVEKIYYNGQCILSGAYSPVGLPGTNALQVNGMHCAKIRTYNRVLTDEEVVNNYVDCLMG